MNLKYAQYAMTSFDTCIKLFGLPASSFRDTQNDVCRMLIQPGLEIKKFKLEHEDLTEMGVFCGTQEHAQAAENYC